MQKSYYYWIIIAIITIFSIFLPTSKSQAAVVFSNLATADNICLGGDVALIFDVPLGQDYRVNSVQIRIQAAAATTVNFAFYSDNAGTLGTQIVALTPLPINVGLGTYTLTPTGPDILANGGRYWLVLEPGAAFWCANGPLVAPTGVFNFVDNGFIIGGNLTSQANGLKLSIDADAIVPLPPTMSSAPFPVCSATDSRLNSICVEPGQTAAIYCRADGTIDVYGITDGEGWLAFRTTQSEIDATGIPDNNTIIEQTDDGRFRLYRLASGEFQVNAPIWDEIRGNLPNGYTFTFDGCS